jgi:hypothetical protein
MNSLISQPPGIHARAEDCIPPERLDELQVVNARLQLLVCELLAKNQQLRFQDGGEELALNGYDR